MRPVTVSATGATSGETYSLPVVLDQYLTPENAGFAVILTSGNLGNNTSTTTTLNGGYSVDISQDDPFATYATSYNVNANWTPLTNYPINTATNNVWSTYGNLSYPVRAIRIRMGGNATSNGAVLTMTVNQSGVR